MEGGLKSMDYTWDSYHNTKYLDWREISLSHLIQGTRTLMQLIFQILETNSWIRHRIDMNLEDFIGLGGTDNARILFYEPEIILILELLIYENYLHMYGSNQ